MLRHQPDIFANAAGLPLSRIAAVIADNPLALYCRYDANKEADIRE
jgi:hypothetical protein